ncbi:histidine kinase A domain protein [Haliscomenobacter hydrossis DSM 1100]|uniref:histidine kinase n=1 Tax=Haliscomenobacter hydrossis (strain ATCC 27775 / DSM 1100 / LMG 10767 / O) TaxID=760192 RepID=F4KWQ4_HALH1|nr:histidine kinase A domain protein [Haliscomenobacter hydrossis DSM 1100]
MKTLRFFHTSRIPLASIISTLVLLFGGLLAYAQLTPYNPQKLAALKKRLPQTEIRSEKARVLLDLHDQLMYSNFAEAYAYNNQALNLAQNLNDKVLMSRAFGNKGNEYFDEADLDKALYYYLKSSDLIDIEEQPLIMALNFSNMANVFALKGDYPTSMEYAYRAIALCKKSPTGLNLKCHTRANLAESYVSLQQFEKAEYLLKLNVKELKTIVSPTVKAMTLSNLGTVYRHKKKNDIAINYIQGALQETEPFGLNYFIASACANLSDLYLLDNRPKLGLPFARRAHHLSMLNEDAQVQTIACRNMARIFLHLGQLDSAHHYVKYALSIAQNKGIQTLQPLVLRTYSAVLKKLKQYQPSLEALKQARMISDSIFSDDTKAESTNRLEAFSVLEAQQNLDQYYAGRLNKVKWWKYIMMITVGLVFLIGLGIYSLYRQRQAANKILTQKGIDIDTQRKLLLDLNQIKDQLFAAIARDLRAPLQSIQSVLANLNQSSKSFTQSQESVILVQLHQQTVRTITLMEDLLFTARVQMQYYQPLRQEFQLKSLTDELDKNLRLLNDGSLAPIIYHIPEDLYLYGDLTMLKMALRNLFLIMVHRPDQLAFPISLSAWRTEEGVTIRLADVQEIDAVARLTQNLTYSKPYWDISLIKTFIESYGGKLNACPEGKGYDIVVPGLA